MSMTIFAQCDQCASSSGGRMLEKRRTGICFGQTSLSVWLERCLCNQCRCAVTLALTQERNMCAFTRFYICTSSRNPEQDEPVYVTSCYLINAAPSMQICIVHAAIAVRMPYVVSFAENQSFCRDAGAVPQEKPCPEHFSHGKTVPCTVPLLPTDICAARRLTDFVTGFQKQQEGGS